MRHFLFLFTLLIGSGVGAQAQSTSPQPEPAPRALNAPRTNSSEENQNRLLAKLSEELDLTEAQTAQVATILASGREKTAALRQQAAGDRQAMMQGMRTIRTEQVAELETVLSADQMIRYRELQAEMRERTRQRRGERRSRGGGR